MADCPVNDTLLCDKSTVQFLRLQSTEATSLSSRSSAMDQTSERALHLPPDLIHPFASTPTTRTIQRSTCQGGDRSATTRNTTTPQWSGCSNSNLSSSASVASRPSVTPMSRLLVSGTKICHSSSTPSSSLGTFGPDNFIELLRSRAMSLARRDNKHQQQPHMVCVLEVVLCPCCHLLDLIRRKIP